MSEILEKYLIFLRLDSRNRELQMFTSRLARNYSNFDISVRILCNFLTKNGLIPKRERYSVATRDPRFLLSMEMRSFRT